jgi:hypothetical protein
MDMDSDPVPLSPELSGPSPTQFTVKRLFWFSSIVALLLALANRLGTWQQIRSAQQMLASMDFSQQIPFLVLAAMLVAAGIGLMIWIGFRVPYLWNSHLFERRRRAARIARLQRRYLRRRQPPDNELDDPDDYQPSEST